MCGVVKKDNIRNERVRGSVIVAPETKKVRELPRKGGQENRRKTADAPVSRFECVSGLSV